MKEGNVPFLSLVFLLFVSLCCAGKCGSPPVTPLHTVHNTAYYSRYGMVVRSLFFLSLTHPFWMESFFGFLRGPRFFFSITHTRHMSVGNLIIEEKQKKERCCCCLDSRERAREKISHSFHFSTIIITTIIITIQPWPTLVN